MGRLLSLSHAGIKKGSSRRFGVSLDHRNKGALASALARDRFVTISSPDRRLEVVVTFETLPHACHYGLPVDVIGHTSA